MRQKKESNFKRQESSNESKPLNCVQIIQSGFKIVEENWKYGQILFLFCFLIIMGIFFLRRGIYELNQTNSIFYGIYLLGLSSSWSFLLFFFRKVRTKMLPLKNKNKSIQELSRSQIDEGSSNSNNKLIRQINQTLKIATLNVTQKNHWTLSGVYQAPLVKDDSNKNKSDNKNQQKNVTIMEENTLSLQNSEHIPAKLILPELGVMVTTLIAVGIIHEEYIASLKNSQLSIEYFPGGLLGLIVLELSAAQLKNVVLNIVYKSIGIGYIFLRSLLSAYYQVESLILIVLIFLYCILSQIKTQNNCSCSQQSSSNLSDEKDLHMIPTTSMALLKNNNNDSTKNCTAKQLNFYKRTSTAANQDNKLKVICNKCQKEEVPSPNLLFPTLPFLPFSHKIPQISESFFDQNSQGRESTRHNNNKENFSCQSPLIKNDINMRGFYGQLLTLLPIGVAIISNSRHLMYISTQMLKMLGCTDKQKALQILLSLSTNPQKPPFFQDQEKDQEEEDAYQDQEQDQREEFLNDYNSGDKNNEVKDESSLLQISQNCINIKMKVEQIPAIPLENEANEREMMEVTKSQILSPSQINDQSRNISNKNDLQDINASINNFTQFYNKDTSKPDSYLSHKKSSLMQQPQIIQSLNSKALSGLTPYNVAAEEERSSRCLIGGEDYEEYGASQGCGQTSKYLKVDEGNSDYGTDRNQVQGFFIQSGQHSPRKMKQKSGFNNLCDEKISTTEEISMKGVSKQLYYEKGEKSIIQEEDNQQSASMVDPIGLINDMEFQLPDYSKPYWPSGSKLNYKSNTFRSMQGGNDSFLETKTEALQKEESVINILNTMLGGCESATSHIGTQVLSKMKSSKKVSSQHANFQPQLSHFSVEAESHASPQTKIYRMDQSCATEHARMQPLDLQNITKSQFPDKIITQKDQKGDNDFEDMVKQKTKLGYFQQEGNISMMQIEYHGETYIIKIIINQVRIKENGALSKVAIIVMEKMWQEFMVKKVEDLINQKMQIFGSLCHELRTPLNCSISMLEVLHNITLNDQKLQLSLDQYIQPALTSNKLLLNMINDILDFVQLENGSFKFGLVEFDLYSLLNECVQLISIQANMKKLKLACYYDPQTPRTIKSDPNRIRQVILNFLSNALKFTVQGHIILFASAYKNLQNITIGVKDSGIGINPENIKKIFKAFNKIDLGEKSKLNLQGCGVGLALSNSIAKALGPEENTGILVESAKDQGSTFSFVVKNQDTNLVIQDEDIYENDENLQEHLFANTPELRRKVTEINSCNRNKEQPTYSTFVSFRSKKITHRQCTASSPKAAGGNIRSKRFSVMTPKITQELCNSLEVQSFNGLDDQHHSRIRSFSQQQIPASRAIINVQQEASYNSQYYKNSKSKDLIDKKSTFQDKIQSPDGFNSYLEKNSPETVMRSLESVQYEINSCECSCSQILLIDDQEFNLFSLTKLLEMFYGIISDTALNENQVKTKIQSKLISKCCKSYKIIFMDINMPIKNGYQMTSLIKQFYNYKNKEFEKRGISTIPPTIIIACSAFNGEEDKIKAKSVGMQDFVTKPIMKKALDVIISKYYEVKVPNNSSLIN